MKDGDEKAEERIDFFMSESERVLAKGRGSRDEHEARQLALQSLAEALESFVEAWDKSHQLEKTDVALRKARAALDEAKPFLKEGL